MKKKMIYVEPAEYFTESARKILEAGENSNRIYNTLYGAIVADALGVPVEFKDRDYLKETLDNF